MTEQRGSRAPAPEAIREEAERLVEAGLAAMSMVADRIGAPTRQRGGAAAAGYEALGDMLFGPARRGHSVANGSEECCRCPVCRVISAARDPDPDVTEKLATGVGALAEGAVRLARGVAGAVGTVWPASPEGSPPGAATRPSGSRRPGCEEDPWAAATAAAATAPAAEPAVAKQDGAEAETAAKQDGPAQQMATKQNGAEQAGGAAQ